MTRARVRGATRVWTAVPDGRGQAGCGFLSSSPLPWSRRGGSSSPPIRAHLSRRLRPSLAGCHRRGPRPARAPTSSRLRAGADPDRLEAGEAADSILRTPPELPPGLLCAAAIAPDRDARTLERLGARVVPFGTADYPARLAALADAPSVLLVRGDPRVFRPGPSRSWAPGQRPGARRSQAAASPRPRRAGSRSSPGSPAESTRRPTTGPSRPGAVHRGARLWPSTGSTRRSTVPSPRRSRSGAPSSRRFPRNVSSTRALPASQPDHQRSLPRRDRHRGPAVEAALDHVRHALDQGRDVFVLPGPTEGPFAEGSNRLLRDGAIAVTDPEDVLEDLGVGTDGECGSTGPDRDAYPPPSRGGLAGRVLTVLATGPRSRETLLVELSVGAGGLAETLLDLELAGLVREERDGGSTGSAAEILRGSARPSSRPQSVRPASLRSFLGLPGRCPGARFRSRPRAGHPPPTSSDPRRPRTARRIRSDPPRRGGRPCRPPAASGRPGSRAGCGVGVASSDEV